MLGPCFLTGINVKCVYSWDEVGESGALGSFPGVPFIKRLLEHMFYGQYHHTLDSKDRMTIPAKFRELVGEGVFVFQGFDHNLMVFTKDHFEILSQQVDGTDLTNTDARLMRRLFFATAEWVDVDKAGRILVPGFLKKAAGLNNEVVLVGAGKFFEIWSKELWVEQSTKLLDIETNVQRLPPLNFPVGNSLVE